MTRTLLPLMAEDISDFTKALSRQLGEAAPSHLTLMNMLARAAGFENVQHMRATHAAGVRLGREVPAIDAGLVERTAARFDDQGRLTDWPAKRAVQTLALWALWARLPKTPLTEREISAHLNGLHSFQDAATLRRTMLGNGMLTRTTDGSVYARTGTPPPELPALMKRLKRA